MQSVVTRAHAPRRTHRRGHAQRVPGPAAVRAVDVRALAQQQASVSFVQTHRDLLLAHYYSAASVHSMSAPWRATHIVVCEGRHRQKRRSCAHTLPTLARALRGYRPCVGPARGARLVQQELHDREPVVGALDVPGPRADDLTARTGPPISRLRGGCVGALKGARASPSPHHQPRIKR